MATVFKLGQKIRFDDESPIKIAHTSMYLSKEEFEMFATLPANQLEKKRSFFELGEFTLVVDQFTGELEGLVLAEIDIGSTGVMPDLLPFDTVAEVTHDERFTGGALANSSAADLLLLLESYGVN
jgi:CYTH domain-containing protein